MTHNSDEDYLPPRKQHLDDVIVTDPQLGDVPFWKSLLWNTAHLREVMMRADSVIERQRFHEDQTIKPSHPEEQKAPPLAADAVAIHRTDPELIKTLTDACQRLSDRLDALEAGREAAQALDDLETALEKEEELPPPKDTTKH
jgi:hypothetical protein